MLARVEQTRSWARHPYIEDQYAGYDLPAALMQWLLREPLDATIFLMDPQSILVGAIDHEVAPGQAMGHHWQNFPVGEGPFNLPSIYTALRAYCVKRELDLPKVQFPLLIHSKDLLKLAPRWLELVGIIRAAADTESEPPGNTVKIAFAIAAAEYQISVTPNDFLASVIEAEDGGKRFQDYCDQYDADVASGQALGLLRPIRRPGVRQARVLDQWYLELSSHGSTVSLNPSAGAIWGLCDGHRTLLDIAQELHAQYDVPIEAMAHDVTQAAKMLRLEGALDLERVINV